MSLIAVISGRGLSQSPGLKVLDSFQIESPYGPCSAEITRGELGGSTLLFLPRHGNPHRLPPHKINYQHPDSNYVKSYKTNLHSEGLNEDLALALKLPGPANNSILIIASYHSLGAPEIANILTDSEKRQELEQIFREKFGKVPQYFEILFRVTGIDKTAYSNQILICNEIHSDGVDQ